LTVKRRKRATKPRDPFSCKKCGTPFAQRLDGNRVKLLVKGRALFIRDGKVEIRCYADRCKTDNVLPFILDPELTGTSTLP